MFVQCSVRSCDSEWPGRAGSGGRHARTAIRIFKMDNSTVDLPYSTRNSAQLRQLGWSGVCGRMDVCVCMAESLPCSLENITTLFVNLLYPNIHKKFKRNPKWSSWDCPGIPVVKTLPSNTEVQDRSLAREVRAHMSCAQKNKTEIETILQ